MSDSAVILFNLGGPTSPETVKPFLFNLFNDRAIIDLPRPVRWFLAMFISSRRNPVAQEIYALMGGKSPIHEETQAQALALAKILEERLGRDAAPSVHVAMRYWGHRAQSVAQELARNGKNRTLFLPLYPQFSTTTSLSSIREWSDVAASTGIGPAWGGICCYPAMHGFIKAAADRIRETLAVHEGPAPRLLFSAHGLPTRVIDSGDPYQWQVERTSAALADELGDIAADHVVCYQSRVGPLKWIGPSTEEEIKRAGADKTPVLVVPVAFVSEHSETLVELDIEYRLLAESVGVPVYLRARTVGTHPAFLGGLADLVETALRDGGLCSDQGGGNCSLHWSRCPQQASSQKYVR